MPGDWKKKSAKLRQKDTDARWAVKNREKHFGYKNHVKTDKRSKIICYYETSTANVHDSQMQERLIEKRDRNKKLWEDSAYRVKDLKDKLVNKHGMKPRWILPDNVNT